MTTCQQRPQFLFPVKTRLNAYKVQNTCYLIYKCNLPFDFSYLQLMPAGVSYTLLSQAVDFIYNGEAKLSQDDWASFLTLARQLQISGLAGIQSLNQLHQEQQQRELQQQQQKKQQQQMFKGGQSKTTSQPPVPYATFAKNSQQQQQRLNPVPNGPVSTTSGNSSKQQPQQNPQQQPQPQQQQQHQFPRIYQVNGLNQLEPQVQPSQDQEQVILKRKLMWLKSRIRGRS